MERQILFRRQKPGSNIWIKGDLITSGIMQGISTSTTEIYPYKKDTLSQYINRTDKNGKKVFEGDIVKRTIKDDGEILTDLFLIFFDDVACAFVMVFINYKLSIEKSFYDIPDEKTFSAEIEVIGNRWDNWNEVRGLFPFIAGVV